MKSTIRTMKITLDDLKGPEIAALLQEHLDDMRATSPPESVHALDLNGLRQPNIRFWTLWDDRNLAGCGALKWLDAEHAEIKSMRTAATYKQQGVASQILQHLINDAKAAGVQRLSLETGSMTFFQPARSLYAKFGFELCGPFADYVLDPNSVFMTKNI
ncbi:GNAT family N-acetyltransferase [Shewanella oneidensis MR-1]|uniref:Acteyltransferase GNAT family YsnE n=1 Tax=Shewanella oneidensis (strain ATCC 700550 / JCM 31522 / CIP 106686 / LMG 19005 / NCIMB 14063 / MR-1) TaxID=211586 RepID=Q8E993_SHEON|nr:GNAT family N-acetyltransferase [Shewanella oneidensis]AAN57360.2 acteyltransferase GNAT family YsnE [Shewanella oneidensis MR-1]MDX5998335.1 GNAT family N-acetyltransferase [Shewanella oneidensis]MEE2029153.1 putative N-acetyltransferase YsnE [Shewanella oneidensis]QKG94693.1 GNAT family N-acetyltransferase [Shewanella oneidensis MR-1]